MPARRLLTMRQLRRALRLHHDGAATRDIGRVLGVARSTVQDALKRAAAAKLPWPLPEDLTDEVLEARLFVRAGAAAGARRRPEPDWGVLVRELKRPGVNMMILWDEYRQVWPDGYGYSRFCDLLRGFQQRLSPVMRQHHVAGDKLFVDYSGKRLGITDPITGEVRLAEIFVAVLGASNYTFAEATWTQTLPDWIGSHVRLLRHLGGAPRLLVPDNLKSGVNKASFYDPEINRSYGRMAAYYEVGVLPTRPRKPKDKAKVEAGVRFAQSYILGRLRHQTFFSLDEANAAIAEVMARMNSRPMRRLGVSRSDLLESLDRPAMSALPAVDYEYAEWRLARVGLDYHIEIEGFFYSVPHALIREQVDSRTTTRTVEIFHRGRRVAAHQRRYGGRRHGTDVEHMPSAHRAYAEWTPERFRSWGAEIGPQTEGLIVAILSNRPQPEQAFRTCMGVLRLCGPLGQDRAESVSARAIAVGALNYKSIASIIAHNLDRPAPVEASVVAHANVRGRGYFH
ncbi:MAG TPA: IS21 family transposase [Phenylobacterium sp.]|nr:IS21 family transposase [Phenylobacterium sp.]HEX3365535.1 IS21 family transposase [Phenylobacterium sp.]